MADSTFWSIVTAMIGTRKVSLNQVENPVAAIFDEPWTLGPAGMVKGRYLQFSWCDGVPEGIEKAGGVWRD
jgi:hypothetical protein